jgi:hypothetical protein
MKFSARIGNMHAIEGGLRPVIELESNAAAFHAAEKYVVRGGTAVFGLIFGRLFGDVDDITSENLMNCLFLKREKQLYAGEIDLEDEIVVQLACRR